MDNKKPSVRKSYRKPVKKINETRVFNLKLSSYVVPPPIEVPSGNYITWGDKHSIPRVLQAALDKSNIHRSIITSLSQELAGYGFIKEDVNGNVNTQLTSILNRKNLVGDTWDKVLDKASKDFAMYGSFALEVHWNLERTKLVGLYHIDFSTIASGLADENDNVRFYYYSLNWDCTEPSTEPIIVFDPETEDENGNKTGRLAAEQILVYRPYESGKNYYPSPDYYSALKWIEIDNILSSYKVNGLKQGFSADMLISLCNGIPEGPERDAIVQSILDNFTGEENNRTVVVDFSEDRDHAALLTPIPTSDSETKYGKMEDEKVKEILFAHRIVSPLLVGIQTGTGFSSNADEIKTAYELFYRKVIQPKQKVLEEQFSEVLKYFGYDFKLKINPALPFEIKSQGKSEAILSAINSLSPLVANKVLDSMTDDEIRALASLPPKPKEIVPVAAPTIENNITND